MLEHKLLTTFTSMWSLAWNRMKLHKNFDKKIHTSRWIFLYKNLEFFSYSISVKILKFFRKILEFFSHLMSI